MEEIQNQQYLPAPETHMTKAILTMIFCCLPFGIVSLVHAAKVEGLWMAGQAEMAIQESNDANKWANIALICGIVGTVLYILVYVLFLGASLSLL